MTLRTSIIALLLLAPLAAQGQASGDTVSVVVPEDRNCSDFVSQQDAQGWYDAMQFLTGQQDAHGLDADGDGQPCESIEVAKREQLYEDVWIDYHLVPSYTYVQCATTQDGFRMQEFFEQAETTLTDSVGYLQEGGLLNRAECLHSISQYQNQ